MRRVVTKVGADFNHFNFDFNLKEGKTNRGISFISRWHAWHGRHGWHGADDGANGQFQSALSSMLKF